MHPLQLGKEMREIEQKIRVAEFRKAFDLRSQWAVRPSDLQEALLLFKPHIVHFSGHGSRNEQIMLENDAGDSKPVGKEALTNLFKILKDNLRVVVLNACFSHTQAEAISGSVEFTVGTSKAVKDAAAISFAASFYRSLAFGRSVREAFELGNNELDLLNIEGSDITRLFVQTGADDRAPFFVRTGTTARRKSKVHS